jgi:hypothetical protein
VQEGSRSEKHGVRAKNLGLRERFSRLHWEYRKEARNSSGHPPRPHRVSPKEIFWDLLAFGSSDRKGRRESL